MPVFNTILEVTDNKLKDEKGTKVYLLFPERMKKEAIKTIKRVQHCLNSDSRYKNQ